MNLEIRKFILQKSLEIEDSIAQVLREILDIENNDNKSLGFKGSALSLKNKVDILFDIGYLTKIDYEGFIMFMEIRNQFIHNIDSVTFEIVLERVKKKKKLLGIDSVLENFVKSKKNGKNTEKIYEIAFSHLCLNLKKTLKSVYESILSKKIKHLEDRIQASERDIYKKINNVIAESIDVFSENIGKAMNEITKSEKDYVEIFKETFTTIIAGKLKEIQEPTR